MKLNTLPRIILADDYHVFQVIPSDTAEYLGINVKCTEIGFNEYHNYVCIVYQGKLPSQKKISALLKKAKIEIIPC